MNNLSAPAGTRASRSAPANRPWAARALWPARSPHTRTATWLFSLALWLLLIAPQGALAQTLTVAIPSSAVVTADRIWLGELAEITGPQAQVEQLQQRLDHVSLGPSPRPGAQRILTRGTVETRLRSALGTQGGFELQLPERVEITRAAMWLGEDQVRAALERWIAESMPLPDVQIEVQEVGLKGPIPVPLGPHEIRFSTQGEPPVGNTSITIAVWQKGAEVARQRVNCKVKVRASVAVLSEQVARGAALSGAELEVAFRDLDAISAMPLAFIAEADGMVTKRALSAGTILTEADVVLQDEVSEGDQVTVYLKSSALTITAPGEARASGRIGDLIPVWCEPTGKVIKAHIIGPGEVQVPYRALSR